MRMLLSIYFGVRNDRELAAKPVDRQPASAASAETYRRNKKKNMKWTM
jgi:hypothetical protein